MKQNAQIMHELQEQIENLQAQVDLQNEQRQSAKFGADAPEKRDDDAPEKNSKEEQIQAIQYEENEYLVKYQQYLKKTQ